MTINELDVLYSGAVNVRAIADSMEEEYINAVMLRTLEEILTPTSLWWEETGRYLPSCGASE